MRYRIWGLVLGAIVALAIVLIGVPAVHAANLSGQTLEKLTRPASSADQVAFEQMLRKDASHLRTGTNGVAPTQPVPQPVPQPLTPAIDSPLPGFVQAVSKSEFGHITGYEAMFWVTRTIPAGTFLAERKIYPDGSVQATSLRQTIFDLVPQSGYPLGGMSQSDWLEGYPVRVQVLIPNFTTASFTIISGEVRSEVNPGDWQATGISRQYQNGAYVLALSGMFNPTVPIAVIINGQKVSAAAIGVDWNQALISINADPGLSQLGGFVGATADVVIEQNGFCTTTQLPVVDATGKG